jgi:hypothetical protein
MSGLGRKRAFSLIAALAVAGCIDMTPLGNDTGDAGADSGVVVDPVLELACRVCLFGENSVCQPQVAACNADDTCRRLLECSTRRGCLTQPTIEAQTMCALPCIDEVGVKTSTDPAVVLSLLLNVCKVTNCKQECGG